MRQRVEPGEFDQVYKTLHKWLLQMRANDVIRSGPILQENALDFARLFGVENFQASSGRVD